MQILDGVTRLASVYLKICAAGCTLFQHFRAVFYCCPTKRQCARVEFDRDGRHNMWGLMSDTDQGQRAACGFATESPVVLV